MSHLGHPRADLPPPRPPVEPPPSRGRSPRPRAPTSTAWSAWAPTSSPGRSWPPTAAGLFPMPVGAAGRAPRLVVARPARRAPARRAAGQPVAAPVVPPLRRAGRHRVRRRWSTPAPTRAGPAAGSPPTIRAAYVELHRARAGRTASRRGRRRRRAGRRPVRRRHRRPVRRRVDVPPRAPTPRRWRWSAWWSVLAEATAQDRLLDVQWRTDHLALAGRGRRARDRLPRAAGDAPRPAALGAVTVRAAARHRVHRGRMVRWPMAGQAVDDAHLLGPLHGRGLERAVPDEPRQGPDRAVDRLRSADPDRLRPRRPAGPRRGRQGRRAGRPPRPHGSSCSTRSRPAR